MREPGYYWVKRGGHWIVAEWAPIEYWYVPGVNHGLPNDKWLEEIDERRIVRKEPADGR